MLQAIDKDIINMYGIEFGISYGEFYIAYYMNNVICTLINPIITKCNRDYLKLSTINGNITFYRLNYFVQIGMW